MQIENVELQVKAVCNAIANQEFLKTIFKLN